MSAKIKEKLLRVPCEVLGIQDPWQYAKTRPEVFSSEEMPDYYSAAKHSVVKRIVIRDPVSAMNDPEVMAFMQDEREGLGKNGNIVLRLSGIPAENRLLVEGDSRKLCERCAERFEKLLIEKGFADHQQV